MTEEIKKLIIYTRKMKKRAVSYTHLHMIMRAIEKAGYKPKEQIVIALDAAASELYDKERKEYVFPGEAKMHGHRVARSTEEMIDYYEELAGEFPIISIEDPLDE